MPTICIKTQISIYSDRSRRYWRLNNTTIWLDESITWHVLFKITGSACSSHWCPSTSKKNRNHISRQPRVLKITQLWLAESIFGINLKVLPCKLYNNKYMTASTQVTNTEIFALITILVFKLLRRNVLFINRKDNRNC